MSLTATEPLTLTPNTDSAPLLNALAQSIAASHPPETWLWINFHRPDGGVNVRYAWTAGGHELGDRIDLLAVATPLDSADWLHIISEHAQTSTRGRIEIQAHPLRPILADVQASVRCPDDRRNALLRAIACAAEHTGQTPRPGTPRWVGVGPTLLARRTP
ncbi:hypothetical protein ACFYOI_03720 [Streptomyces microflavus]|uniref:hypothetical protein n=1 Tax=Streptomyces microflavus TaxID=1919 RepID=UPI0033B8D38C